MIPHRMFGTGLATAPAGGGSESGGTAEGAAGAEGGAVQADLERRRRHGRPALDTGGGGGSAGGAEARPALQSVRIDFLDAARLRGSVASAGHVSSSSSSSSSCTAFSSSFATARAGDGASTAAGVGRPEPGRPTAAGIRRPAAVQRHHQIDADVVGRRSRSLSAQLGRPLESRHRTHHLIDHPLTRTHFRQTKLFNIFIAFPLTLLSIGVRLFCSV